MGEGRTHSALGLDPGPLPPGVTGGVGHFLGHLHTVLATNLAMVTLQQQGEGLVSTLEVLALSSGQGSAGEISCARNSLSESWMGLQALEASQIPGEWNQINWSPSLTWHCGGPARHWRGWG